MNNANKLINLKKITEALLFVQNKPLKIPNLAKLVNTSAKQMEGIINEISDSLDNHGIKIQSGPEGVQLITIPEANETINNANNLDANKPLTKATLETLAIIAYKQPITRAEIESIRGVNCDGHITNLRIKGLIEIFGRAEKIGRPQLFSTTQNFLSYFGLQNANQLPDFIQENKENISS